MAPGAFSHNTVWCTVVQNRPYSHRNLTLTQILSCLLKNHPDKPTAGSFNRRLDDCRA
jgi:hypothetical protein